MIGTYFILLCVALLANALAAFSGGGAGLLQFPALIFLGLPFSIALATHKVATVALGVGSTARYVREHLFSWRFAAFMLAVGIPGAILGACAIVKVDDGVAQIALGVFMLIPGIYSICKPKLGLVEETKNRSWRGFVIGGLVLFIIGFLNGSLTSGTGLLVTLWLVRWFGFEYKKAVAYTMVLTGFFWNAAGAITMIMMSSVQWDWLVPLLIGAVVGGYAGAHISIKQGSGWVKRGFEFVTIAIGLTLIWRGLK